MSVHVLVTGAGSAAAVMFLQAAAAENVVLFAADKDPYAPGLYMVPESRRLRLPRADDPAYVAALLQLCWQHRIGILVPGGTAAEQLRISNQRGSFELMGTTVLLAPAEAVACAQDQLAIRMACEGVVPLPTTRLLSFRFQAGEGPWLLRPRFDRGRPVRLLRSAAELAELPRDESLLVQEYLPGEEYRVDTLMTPDGHPLVAIPRMHLQMEQGAIVAARSFHDPELEELALRVVAGVGLCWAASVCFRRDARGELKLTNIKAHFQGGMSFAVSAGINLPALCLALAQGHSVEGRLSFREVVVVRHWEQQVIEQRAPRYALAA